MTEIDPGLARTIRRMSGDEIAHMLATVPAHSVGSPMHEAFQAEDKRRRTAPLGALLTSRELARVSREYTATTPRDPERSKSDYIAGLRAVAVRLYPGKVSA